MRMPPFELHLPESLDSAMTIAGELADEDCDFDWIAVGTDVLPNYMWHLNSKPHVISLAKVSELSTLQHIASELYSMPRWRNGCVTGSVVP